MSAKIIKQPAQRPCPYCGLVPATRHPDYTCPRISDIQIDGDAVGISFVDPMEWASFVALCLHQAGDGDQS